EASIPLGVGRRRDVDAAPPSLLGEANTELDHLLADPLGAQVWPYPELVEDAVGAVGEERERLAEREECCRLPRVVEALERPVRALISLPLLGRSAKRFLRQHGVRPEQLRVQKAQTPRDLLRVLAHRQLTDFHEPTSTR